MCRSIYYFLCLCLMSCDFIRRRAYVRSSKKFAIILFNEVLKNRVDNFILCPPLLATALIFALSGSRNNTTGDILDFLHLPIRRQDVEELMKILHVKMKSLEHYSIKFSHKLYINKDYNIREDFQQIAKEIHESYIENIDFGKNMFIVQKVNTWVKTESGELISDLVDINDVNNLTDSLLVSVALFKANWASPFLLSETTKSIFFKLNHEVIEVEFMNSSGKYYKYNESFKLQAKFLEIPFLGEEASMIIVLPYKAEGIAFLEKKIDKIVASCSFLDLELVNITIPKFKITSKHLFKKSLQDLGLVSIFRDDEADFSEIAEDQGELVINEIIQGVFIDVSEDGVGADTGNSILVPVPQRGESVRKLPKTFVVNHPFIFFIKVQKIILYAGKILEPVQ